MRVSLQFLKPKAAGCLLHPEYLLIAKLDSHSLDE